MKNYLLKLDDTSSDTYLASFVVVYFLVQAANLFVKYYIGFFAAWSFISKAILGYFLFKALIVILRRKLKSFLLIELLFIALFSITLIAGTTGRPNDFSNIIFNSLVVYIPLGLTVLSMKDYSILHKKLYTYGWITQSILIFLAFVFVSSSREYIMSIGYALLLQMLIFIDAFLKNKKLYILPIIFLDLFLIVSIGSRGPLVSLIVYFLIRILYSEIPKHRKYLNVSLLMFISLIFYMFDNQIYLLIKHIFDFLNISSRSIDLLIDGSFTDVSSRYVIYTRTIELIEKSPILGYGLTGGWQNHEYPHNIFLEFSLSFGLFIGIVLSFLWVLLLVSGLKQKSKSKQRLAHIFIALSVSLFFSGSFILEQSFFIIIALCLNSNNRIIFKRS